MISIYLSKFILIETYHLDDHGRCRWCTNKGESFLFVKYGLNKVNILDVEKKALTLESPIESETQAGEYPCISFFLPYSRIPLLFFFFFFFFIFV